MGVLSACGINQELPPHHVRLDQTAASSARLLCQGPSPPEEMEEEEHDPHDQNDVKQAGGNVKCKESE
jgi:hypothetical protein